MKKNTYWGIVVCLFINEFCLSQASNVQVTKQVLPAVVTIKGKTDNGEISGSGFIITTNGRIVTSLHVISQMVTATVILSSGDIYDSVKVVAYDDRRDLAIIQIPGYDLPTVRLGNSNNVTEAENVLLIGAANGLQGSITSGIISAIRKLPEGFSVIQTDAAANPGNSGGPLINSAGEVIGILGFKIVGAEGQNFAVPINYARGIADNAQLDVDINAFRLKMSSTKSQLSVKNINSRVKSLKEVKSVFVSTLGTSNGAIIAREKLINALFQRRINVVAEAESDAILDGIVTTSSNGEITSVVCRLLGYNDQILWSAEAVWNVWSGGDAIPKKIADQLEKAIKK